MDGISRKRMVYTLQDTSLEQWWKDKSAKKEWTLPNGKKIRQHTLEEWIDGCKKESSETR